jgi:triphosphatase
MTSPRTTSRKATRPAPSKVDERVPPREVELKLAVPVVAVPALQRRLRALGSADIVRLQTTYFDTADLLLAHHAMALRLRRDGARWVQTLKTGPATGAFSSRGEWEATVPAARLQLGRLRQTPLPSLLREAGNPPLLPIFSTRFARARRMVETGESIVEVALDRGAVIVGTGLRAKKLPLLELELELKRGHARALFDLARQLMEGDDETAPLPLLPFAESKAARGYRLLADRPPSPAKAGASRFTTALRPGQSAQRALRHVMAVGTDLVLANTQSWLAHGDPECIHQARVALRRMRSALRLWRAHARFPKPLASELRWISRELGAARDADVFSLETLPAVLGRAKLTGAAASELVTRAQSRRDETHRALRLTLASGRHALLSLRLLAWAAVKPRKPSASKRASLRDLAARDLACAHAKLLTAARFFAAQSAERRHRVRILAKRLRYALDLYTVALPGEATANFSACLASLQDVLGELNDISVAMAALSGIAAAEGVVPALREAEQQGIINAERALEALAETPVPWR